MKRVIDKHRLYSVERVLFPDDQILDSRCDLIRYMRFDKQQPMFSTAIEDVAYTYLTDLSTPANELIASFSKTVRYEIRRSEKDALTILFYDTEALKENQAVLKDFTATYLHFCELCGNQELKSVLDEGLIHTYIRNGCFLLSAAEFANGKVYHAYFFSDSSACLWYSASDFRNQDVDRNLAARANRRLHLEDMKYFQNWGIRFYDWGNVSTRNNENPNGIDQFKASFGGTYSEKYSYTVANTLWGRILLFGKKLLTRHGAQEK